MKKTRLCKIALTIAVISFVPTCLSADTSTPHHEHLKLLESTIGDWDITGEMIQGDESPMRFKHRRTVKWTLGKQFIETEITSEETTEVLCKSIIGWDEKDQVIKEWGFWNMQTSDAVKAWTNTVTWKKVHDSNLSFEELRYWAPVERLWQFTGSGQNGKLVVFTKDRHKYDCGIFQKDGKTIRWQYVAERRRKPPAK